MKHHKKKKREDYSRRRRQSKSTSHIPTKLTKEILLRLPEKSVARFRCVSKLWSSITTDPYFINLFETRSPRPSLLLCFKKEDNMFVSSIPQHNYRHTLRRHNSNKSFFSSQHIGCYQTGFPEEYNRFSTSECVHGLICFQESGNPVVWNPSKREFLMLTKPRKRWNYIIVLLGYDPIEGRHKLVCLPDISSDLSLVLTLGSAQESWRTVETTHQHPSAFHTTARCIKGFIYYLAYTYHTRVWVIMSFDVRSEKINMIQYPSDIYQCLLINYGGRLAFLDRHNKRRMWTLEDAAEHKWSSQDFLIPLRQFHKGLRTSLKLKGFTHAGELIFAPTLFRLWPYILYYDPVRNSCRRFELGRIVGNEYVLNDDGPMFAFQAFPNHIDGQISM